MSSFDWIDWDGSSAVEVGGFSRTRGFQLLQAAKWQALRFDAAELAILRNILSDMSKRADSAPYSMNARFFTYTFRFLM